MHVFDAEQLKTNNNSISAKQSYVSKLGEVHVHVTYRIVVYLEQLHQCFRL